MYFLGERPLSCRLLEEGLHLADGLPECFGDPPGAFGRARAVAHIIVAEGEAIGEAVQARRPRLAASRHLEEAPAGGLFPPGGPLLGGGHDVQFRWRGLPLVVALLGRAPVAIQLPPFVPPGEPAAAPEFEHRALG